jgi:hypothetical protein
MFAIQSSIREEDILRAKFTIAAAILTVLLTATPGVAEEDRDECAHGEMLPGSKPGVPFLRILAHPRCYNGKSVQTVAYLGVDPVLALYLSRDDVADGVALNGAAVDAKVSILDTNDSVGAAFLIEGTVNVLDGHVGMFWIEFTDVRRLLRWSPGKGEGVNLVR